LSRARRWWTITLRGACDENAIHDVFLFVEDASTLQVEEIEENRKPAAAGPSGPCATELVFSSEEPALVDGVAVSA
jgi:hypothetical protein